MGLVGVATQAMGKTFPSFSETNPFHKDWVSVLCFAALAYSLYYFAQKPVEDAPVVEISLAAEGLVDLGTEATGTVVRIPEALGKPSMAEPESIAPATGDMGTIVRIPKLLVLAGLASSSGEANRKLAENAVSLNGERLGGRLLSKERLGESPVLRLGKKSVRIEWVK